jgi:hypothetical protein
MAMEEMWRGDVDVMKVKGGEGEVSQMSKGHSIIPGETWRKDLGGYGACMQH